MKLRIPEIIYEILVPITNRWADEQTFWSRYFEVYEIHFKGIFTNRRFYLRKAKIFKEVA